MNNKSVMYGIKDNTNWKYYAGYDDCDDIPIFSDDIKDSRLFPTIQQAQHELDFIKEQEESCKDYEIFGLVCQENV